MILKCPKCKKEFPLRGPKNNQRFDVGEHLACRECSYTLPALEFVGQIRCGEFLEWVNAWNASLIKLKEIEAERPKRENVKKPKSLWEIVISDSALRKILISEEKLKETDSTPSLRLVVRSAERPTNDFILGKFKEHLNEIYQYGYIDPFIQRCFMCMATDREFFDI